MSTPQPITLEGSGWPPLTLRQLTTGDTDPLFALIEANRKQLRAANTNWAFQTRETLEHFLQSITPSQDLRDLCFGVWSEGALVGVASLSLDSENDAKLGYWIGAASWHKGIATAAATTLVEYAFAARGLRILFAEVNKKNAASQKVLGRSGFCIEVADDTEWLICRQENPRLRAAM